MKYYKVKPEYDNKHRSDNSILVTNELYTKAEKQRYDIPNNAVVEIDVPQKSTYFFFGARFSDWK